MAAEVVERDVGRARQLRVVLRDRIGERELAVLLERERGGAHELLGDRADRERGVVGDRGPALLRGAVAAREHGLAYRVSDPGTLEVRAPALAGINGVVPPRVKEEARAAFPEGARADRARVVLAALVCEDGRVGALSVRESPVEIAFREAARQAPHHRHAPRSHRENLSGGKVGSARPDGSELLQRYLQAAVGA